MVVRSEARDLREKFRCKDVVPSEARDLRLLFRLCRSPEPLLHAELLSLFPECPTNGAEFAADKSVDPLTRVANGLTNVMLDAINRDLLHQLTATLLGPASSRNASAPGRLSGPGGAPRERGNRTLPRGAAAEKEGGCGANCGADECCGKEVVLRLTRIPVAAFGLADARAPFGRRRDRRCCHRLVPLTTPAPRLHRYRHRLHGEAPLHPRAPRAPSTP